MPNKIVSETTKIRVNKLKMDAVHYPDDRISISEAINVATFVKEWRELLNGHLAEPVKSEEDEINFLSCQLELPVEAIKEIACDCSINNLQCEEELQLPLTSPTINRLKLVSLRILDQIEKKCKENKNMLQHMRSISKYRFFEPNLRTSYSKRKGSDTEMLNKDEVILTVNVYQPYKKEPDAKQANLKIEQEIQVLGSQFLTDLRDRITCLGDVSVPGDFSENPDLPQDVRAKDIWTSGFFYINGIFYNDMRNPQSRDCSQVITDWASQNPELELGPFTSEKMEETKFLALSIRLGYPYVYQHQGNCEHLLVFRDLRLVNPLDCQDRSQYPLIRGISKRRRIICMICHVMTARWVTTGNDRLTQDPFFFCDTCFRSFNYTNEGEKIGQFQAHPFFDRSALM